MSDEEDSDKTKSAQLLYDHEQASEEARYRDKLLYNSYYLAVIVLFLLGQSILTVVTNNRNELLPIILLSGSAVYFLLTAWALGVRDSRNNAWQRRENIEEKFDGLQTNTYTKLAVGKYKRENEADSFFEAIEYARKNLRQWSDISEVVSYAAPDLVSWFLIPISVLCFLLGVVTLVFYYILPL